MESSRLSIPVGISDFEKIRTGGFAYVDKTGLIADLLGARAEVTLITRPRRFGKTLAMSMLASFFDIRRESGALFEGLAAAENKALCEEWMNRWPVVFLSLKNVDGLQFRGAYGQLVYELSLLFQEHAYLLDSSALSPEDRELFRRLSERRAEPTEVARSLQFLTALLERHYGRGVILLVDEYDVPLTKASRHGYYEEMLEVMRGLMQACKDNPALQFAVITGCLRIAKESIFTGTNNFVSDSIADSHLGEYYGFVQEEVDRLLHEAGAGERSEEVRKWYDGYRFGETEVYCPWDVMNYLLDLQRNPKARPRGYWRNTSDNAVIRSFIDCAGSSITGKLETLMAGGSIVQQVDENLTYDYLHSSEENLWSLLYLTGYLTSAASEKENCPADGRMRLRIPNAEIREIFEATVVKWFQDSAGGWERGTLFHAVWSGDCELLTQEMNRLLRRTISYHDYREDFYHAFLAGIFTGAGYAVDSNKEHGEGRSDVAVHDAVHGRVAVFEVKYAGSPEDLARSCDAALRQMEERQYAREYEDDYDEIRCYGIAFFKKRCLVKSRESAAKALAGGNTGK